MEFSSFQAKFAFYAVKMPDIAEKQRMAPNFLLLRLVAMERSRGQKIFKIIRPGHPHGCQLEQDAEQDQGQMQSPGPGRSWPAAEETFQQKQGPKSRTEQQGIKSQLYQIALPEGVPPGIPPKVRILPPPGKGGQHAGNHGQAPG